MKQWWAKLPDHRDRTDCLELMPDAVQDGATIDLLQAPRTAGGEIGDLLQRMSEWRPDSACLVCGSGGGDLSVWHVPTQMKSELKQRNPETEMSNSFNSIGVGGVMWSQDSHISDHNIAAHRKDYPAFISQLGQQ